MTKSTTAKSSGIWMQGLGCGIMLTFAAPTVMLLLALFAPALGCLIAETPGGRGMTRAVALTCAAASVSPVWRLWRGGGHWDAAMMILADPATLLLAWGAGAFAWSLCQVLPVIFRVIWDAQQTARAKSLEAELAALHENWDIS